MAAPSAAPISAVMTLSWRIIRRACRRGIPIVHSTRQRDSNRPTCASAAGSSRVTSQQLPWKGRTMFTTRLMVAAVALTLAAFVAPAQAAQRYGWAPTVELSAAGQHAWNPEVAYSENGDAVFVWGRYTGYEYVAQMVTRSAAGTLGRCAGSPTPRRRRRARRPEGRHRRRGQRPDRLDALGRRRLAGPGALAGGRRPRRHRDAVRLRRERIGSRGRGQRTRARRRHVDPRRRRHRRPHGRSAHDVDRRRRRRPRGHLGVGPGRAGGGCRDRPRR